MLKLIAVTVILIAFAVALPAIPVFYLGKMLIDNIIIRVKGEKYIGTCVKYIRGRYGGLDVYWNDGKRKHHQRFVHVMPVKFKYPHEIKVYSLNNSPNLGLLTITGNFIYFAFFAFIWIVCIMGAVNILCDISKYGL